MFISLLRFSFDVIVYLCYFTLGAIGVMFFEIPTQPGFELGSCAYEAGSLTTTLSYGAQKFLQGVIDAGVKGIRD